MGQGTTFFLQFPVAEAPPSADQALDIPLQETPRVAQPSPSIPAARRMSNRVENLNILIAVRDMLFGSIDARDSLRYWVVLPLAFCLHSSYP